MNPTPPSSMSSLVRGLERVITNLNATTNAVAGLVGADTQASHAAHVVVGQLAEQIQVLGEITTAIAEGAPESTRDQRIVAWEKLVQHPIFEPCYDNPVLLEGMTQLLDKLHAAEQRRAAAPEERIDGHWLVEVVDEHTCGAGGEWGHEPGCGVIPLVDLRGLEGWGTLVAEVLSGVQVTDEMVAAFGEAWRQETMAAWGDEDRKPGRRRRAGLAAALRAAR